MTVISILVSIFNMSYTSWKLGCFERHQKNLELQSSKLTSNLSFLAWFFTIKIGHILSLVLLAMVIWIEMFSEANPVYLEVNVKFLPVCILLLAFPLNLVIFKKFVKDEDAFAVAHGLLSAVFPSK